MKKIISFVLAAGRGTRLGGAKALLLWPFESAGAPIRPFSPRAQSKEPTREIPLAIAHARTRLAAESERVLIVVRAPILRALLPFVEPGIELLTSSAPDELGPAGSIATAVPHIHGAEAVLVVPVDTPPIAATTTRQLIDRLGAPNQSAPQTLAVRPRFGGRAGHPVLLRAEALAVYKNNSAPPSLRDHLRSLGPACIDTDIDDPMVLRDLNTPEDYLGLWAKKPRFLSSA